VKVPGVWGQKQVTYRITKQDSTEVKREVIDVQILSQPKTQVVVKGTRQAPNLATGNFYWPVVGTITSKYGPRWGRTHAGIDIAVPTGTPIKAADDGTVVWVGWDGNYGRCIRIDHGGGHIVTLYAHLSGYTVEEGDTVHRGDVIGYSGNTGYSTGPHLHFEVRVDGVAKNPLSFYPAMR
jgi:murein DD-endopeptidase MepM/ murein hydrolase activator NlpD